MAALGSVSVGSIVKLNVNGSARNFIVVHQGLPSAVYDSSCDGTCLMMEELYESRAYDSADNDYANSDIHNYLNNTFIDLFDGDLKSVIKQAKIPYTRGTGPSGSVETGANGLSAKVFLPTYTEVGLSGYKYVNTEGAVFAYFSGAANSKRVAYLNGKATAWWLRSPTTYNATNGIPIIAQGNINGTVSVKYDYGIRPTLVLPKELNVDDSGFVIAAPPFAPNLRENYNGSLKNIVGMYENVGGTLKKIIRVYENVNGVLVES